MSHGSAACATHVDAALVVVDHRRVLPGDRGVAQHVVAALLVAPEEVHALRGHHVRGAVAVVAERLQPRVRIGLDGHARPAANAHNRQARLGLAQLQQRSPSRLALVPVGRVEGGSAGAQEGGAARGVHGARSPRLVDGLLGPTVDQLMPPLPDSARKPLQTAFLF
ncbi:hypothetical protein ON010_g107 [Phytophthora cinnamomi]|nr:hypothetical protein ON010_g107 [Phytophthora cinnamomi]